MNKEAVHLIATTLWGLYGLAIGSISAIAHDFTIYIMVSIITAIAGNSAHLISMALSKTGITETATK